MNAPILCGAMLLASFPTLASAQGQAPEIPVTALGPKVDPAFKKGKVSLAEGTAGPLGQRFTVDGLYVMQPVSIVLMAKDPKDKLELAVSKVGWAQPERKATTGAGGTATVWFRTQGGCNIEVKSATPGKAYQLLVVVHDELKPDLGTPFKVTPELAKRKNAGAKK